jgi:hypothetical protein
LDRRFYGRKPSQYPWRRDAAEKRNWQSSTEEGNRSDYVAAKTFRCADN